MAYMSQTTRSVLAITLAAAIVLLLLKGMYHGGQMIGGVFGGGKHLHYAKLANDNALQNKVRSGGGQSSAAGQRAAGPIRGGGVNQAEVVLEKPEVRPVLPPPSDGRLPHHGNHKGRHHLPPPTGSGRRG